MYSLYGGIAYEYYNIETWHNEQHSVEDKPRVLRAGDVVPGTASPQLYPDAFPGANPNWGNLHNPQFQPINPVPDPFTNPPPLNKPPLSEPWSPEAPNHGPRPEPKPEPGTNPGTDPGTFPGTNPGPVPGTPVQPVPEVVPEIIPEIEWKPAPVHATASYGLRGTPKHSPKPHRARRPPKGTKETKAKIHPVLGFIWNSFSPITETIDLINVFYECLPWDLKVQQYNSRGKQPTPSDKIGIIYENINSLDVGCAVISYIQEQLEDMLYSIGSGKIKEANQKDNRPIGYEAGGSLTGGGPFVGISR